MRFRNGKWKVFFILLFLLTIWQPLSWLLISKLFPVTFFFLLLLHQCSFLFGYLSSVILYEVGTALCTQLSNSLDEGEMGRETKPYVISAYALLEIRKCISVVGPRDMVSSH